MRQNFNRRMGAAWAVAVLLAAGSLAFWGPDGRGMRGATVGGSMAGSSGPAGATDAAGERDWLQKPEQPADRHAGQESADERWRRRELRPQPPAQPQAATESGAAR